MHVDALVPNPHLLLLSFPGTHPRTLPRSTILIAACLQLFDSQAMGTFPDVQPADSILWQTATGGVGSDYELFEGGNLQVRAPSGKSLWALGNFTFTLGKPYITVTND